MRRFLIDPSCVDGNTISLTDKQEINHIRNVLRLKPSAEVLLADGTGQEYYSQLSSYEKDGSNLIANFAVLYTRMVNSGNKMHVTLFQCVPKSSKMETIIQKSVELGVGAVVPVLSSRTLLRSDDVLKKLDRWRKIADEACKQSGQSVVPEVSSAIDISEIPEYLSDFPLVVFPYEKERNVSIKHILHEACEQSSDNLPKFALIIGPEGGFSDDEAELLISAGAKVCSLGETILRTETAGPAAIAMMKYECEL